MEFSGAGVLTLGDVMLDCSAYCRLEQISPEASGAVHVEVAWAREVFDVAGAGETVIAVRALAAGHARPDATRLANTAGVVASKLGTATPELMLEASRDCKNRAPLHATYSSLAAVETLVGQCRSRGLTIGVTNGSLGIVHPGHVGTLGAAHNECDRLVVAFNEDDSVPRPKGASRPCNALANRAAVIADLGSVNPVLSFAGDTSLELIHCLKPDVLMKAADYTAETVVGAEDVIASGGRVALIDLVGGHWTTKVSGRLQAPARVG